MKQVSFSLRDLKVVRDSLFMTSECSEFQTDQVEHWKQSFEKTVLVNGMESSGISEERNVRFI